MSHLNERRMNIAKHLKEGEFLVLFAGEPIYESMDETFPFSVNRNFYYVTGLDIQHGIVVLFTLQGKPQIHSGYGYL